MEVVQETAFFIPGGTDQSGEFCLEEQLLARLGVHHDYKRDGIFGELGGFA
jgi:hypothetical protein